MSESHTTAFRLKWKMGQGVMPRPKETSVEFCCEQMKDAWRTFVGFDRWRGNCEDADPEVSLASPEMYPEGTWFQFCPIRFCPFCSAEIEVNEA